MREIGRAHQGKRAATFETSYFCTTVDRKWYDRDGEVHTSRRTIKDDARSYDPYWDDRDEDELAALVKMVERIHDARVKIEGGEPEYREQAVQHCQDLRDRIWIRRCTIDDPAYGDRYRPLHETDIEAITNAWEDAAKIDRCCVCSTWEIDPITCEQCNQKACDECSPHCPDCGTILCKTCMHLHHH